MTKRMYTLGSLFDGSGGFPLAGSLCGIKPVWASEVEPYPIAVTRSRFPDMLHLGDISKVNGAEIPPVDIITFGSPCQDLSVAGKRAGLKHEDNGDEETTRSGLFMEAVRIIKEMRSATDGRYPTFALWENVPGAFSSNKGEDFRIVLEELIKIVEPTAAVPPMPKGGWPYADAYMGDGWSVAYRTFDAQYWGVPQRRRRIHLIADFRAERAAKILFERDGLRGYFAESGTPWQGTAAATENGIGAADREGANDGCKCLTPWDCQSKRIFDPSGVYPTLQAMGDGGANNTAVLIETVADKENCIAFHLLQDPIFANDKTPCLTSGNPDRGQAAIGVAMAAPSVVYSAGFCPEQGAKTRGIGYEDERAPTLRAGVVPAACIKCFDTCGNGDGKTVPTLTGDHENRVTDYTAVVVEGAPVYCLQGNGIDRADTAGCNGKDVKEDISYTLNTLDRHAVVYAISSKQQSLVTSENLANTLGANDYKEPQAVAFAMQGFGDYKESNVASGIKARDYKDATDLVVEGERPIALDRAFYNQGKNAQYDPQLYTDGTCPTLVARGPAAVCVRYIVRRLTPTECARLQGFADRWGHIDHKEDFDEEEYRFWLNVRNTHATINGKAVKEYTKEQMLAWYNKLHTDSSEYKMWGNGIALPPALYCMQGISDELEETP